MLPAFLNLPSSAGYVLAGLFSCAPPTAPSITLEFQNNPPKISNTRSSSYLLSLKKSSSSPNYGGEFPILDGLTNGNIQTKYELGYALIEEVSTRQTCIHLKSAHITITYTPTIYITRKAKPDSCRYKVTLKHEMRHVNADIDTINEYTPYIKSLAEKALEPDHYPMPLAADKTKDFRDRLSDKMSRAMNSATDELQKSRIARQHKIDSRQEYERLSKACTLNTR